ncbi:hypothetical protein niasHT_018587 [Heterodera trifolii]|uniref:Peroxidase n=1 Tax=Heterodera trifolii TaxID=157864 RepID=A0ABD2LBK3_9BILA
MQCITKFTSNIHRTKSVFMSIHVRSCCININDTLSNHSVSDSVLFQTTDLGTLNIARGRDHGLPSYNKMRRACGLNAFSTFDQLADLIRDPAIRGALSSLYESPDDIDLYVGGLVEEPLIGALVGPTFACIIGDQFKRTRDGDRFYYENPGIFSSAQLAELKKTSMARLLCDNGDHISKVPFDALLLPSAIGTVPCARLAQLDLRKWSE